MLHRSALYGIVGSTIIIAVMAATIAALKGPDPHRPPVTLLYVGAEDCAPCREWQQHEKIAFSTSAEFARLKYREIKSPTLLNLLKDENWPEELRGYRDLLGPDAGVPLWLVIADERVIQRGMGPSQWRSDVLPKINKLLR
jgi:hypothetical protein